MIRQDTTYPPFVRQARVKQVLKIPNPAPHRHARHLPLVFFRLPPGVTERHVSRRDGKLRVPRHPLALPSAQPVRRSPSVLRVTAIRHQPGDGAGDALPLAPWPAPVQHADDAALARQEASPRRADAHGEGRHGAEAGYHDSSHVCGLTRPLPSHCPFVVAGERCFWGRVRMDGAL